MRRILTIIIDLVIIYAAIILSFLLLKNGVLLNYSNNIGAFYFISPLIIPIYLILAYVFGMLKTQQKNFGEIIYTVFIVSVALTISIMAAIFFIRGSATSYPRSVVLLSALLYFTLLSLWRYILSLVYHKWHGRRTVMIVGTSPQLINNLNTRYQKLFEVKYQISEKDDTLFEKAKDVDDIFIADNIDNDSREKIVLLNNEYQNKNIYYLPKINDIAVINSKLNRFGDLPTHVFSKMFLSAEERVAKRIMDIVISILFLILFSPIFILIAILVKLDGGDIFYKQERWTRERKSFDIIKFRTMIQNAENNSGPILSEKKDCRITWIGKFLRTSRLDEIPQFWNILKGEMSIVGPRPERPFAEKIEKELPEFKYRLNVKAGLTGFAQVMGKYNTDFTQKLQYDLYYINNFSVIKDILIMLQTINIIFWKENADGVDIS